MIEKTHRESDFFGRPFNVYVELHGHAGMSLAYLGRFKEGETLCEKGLRFAHDINHLGSLALVEYSYGRLFSLKGDGVNAIKHSKNCIKYCEEGEAPVLLPGSLYVLGIGHYYLGELETARNHIQRGLGSAQSLGSSWAMPLLRQALSEIHLDLGEFKNAESYAEKNLGKKISFGYLEGFSMIILGRITGKREFSQIKVAEEHILKGIKILDNLKYKPFVARGYFYFGELYADVGQKEKALGSLRKAEEMFREMGMDHYLTKTQEVLGRL